MIFLITFCIGVIAFGIMEYVLGEEEDGQDRRTDGEDDSYESANGDKRR